MWWRRASAGCAGLALVAAPAPVAAEAGEVARARPHVVLVHGWAGDRTLWAPVRLRLGRGTSAIDLPGHGEDPTDISGWPLRRLAAAIERHRIAVGARCLVIAAHSYGAFVAREYWRLHPDRLGSLVLVEGSLLKPFESEAEWRQRRAAVDAGWAALQRTPFGLDAATPATRRAVSTSLARARRTSALAFLDMLAEPALWRDEVVAAPVAFAFARSPFWTADRVSRLQRLAPRSEVSWLGRVSHFAQLDAPSRTAALIRLARRRARCADAG